MARFCPRGDGAFEDWVERCPECGSPLETEPPDEEALQDALADAPIVWLATAANEVEALMWAGALRAQRIPVLLRPGGPGAGAWASSATFEHGLYVRESDLAGARAMLDGMVNATRSRARRRRAAPRVRRRSLRRAG